MSAGGFVMVFLGGYVAFYAYLAVIYITASDSEFRSLEFKNAINGSLFFGTLFTPWIFVPLVLADFWISRLLVWLRNSYRARKNRDAEKAHGLETEA